MASSSIERSSSAGSSLLLLFLVLAVGCEGRATSAGERETTAYAGGSESGSQPPGTLFDPIRTWDFGEVPKGTSPSHAEEFEIAPGLSCRVVSVKSTCGCTVSELTHRTSQAGRYADYSPGEVLEEGTLLLSLKLETEDKSGPYEGHVRLIGDDQGTLAEVRLKGTVLPFVSMTPPFLDVGVVGLGEIVTASSVLTVGLLQITEVNPLPPGRASPMSVLVEPVGSGDDQPLEAWTVAVSFDPSSHKGAYSSSFFEYVDLGLVYRGTHHEKFGDLNDKAPRTVRLGIQARIVGEVYAEPEHLSFGHLKAGETIERNLVLAGIRREELQAGLNIRLDEPAEGVADDGLEFELRVSEHAKGVEITLAATLELAGGPSPFRREVVIEIPEREIALAIPVFGVQAP